MSKFWNKDNTKVALEAYEAGDSPVVIAKAVQAKSAKAVIGKLVSEGVYVKAEKPARKTPVDDGPTKDQILEVIAATGFDTKGFEGATKPALKRLQEIV